MSLIKALLKRWKIILLITVIFCIASFLFTYNFIAPVYSVSTTMYIRNTDNYKGDIYSGDILSSQELCNTFSVLIKSSSVMEKVAQNVNADISTLGYTASQISSMVSATPITKTSIINISVRSTNPYIAQNIANVISEVAPDEIMGIIGAGHAEIIDKAKISEYPFYPNINQNVMLAGLIGFAFSCIIIILIEILDTSIKSENDLRQITDIPIIGIIPNEPESINFRGGDLGVFKRKSK